MNYFEFYNIPLRFNIDARELKKKYLEFSKKYHPDFHTLTSPLKQEDMLELSILNNQAFQTLSNKESVIKYILMIEGLIKESETRQEAPPDFLMDMMERNEQIAEWKNSGRDADTGQNILNSLRRLELELEAEVTKAMNSFDAKDSSNTEQNLIDIKSFYLKSQYLKRIKTNFE